ncbi:MULTISPECIES: carbon-nitrogen hydrolase family protein [Nocardia]|uniref:carbon-nitrogen hydrolase family protein n=1 Tax=Nocardia TaxID=1817 RepID=UPI0005C183C8|nr:MULTISPECIES: carbon-nitrogen hydrolase family protein [Nocardia]
MVRVAAVQLTAVPTDVDANLAACERLATAAVGDGAEIVALPEFFTTGIGFDDRLPAAALPPDGAATQLLCELAAQHDILIGGSFLCRDRDGHVRNAYLLAGPDGILGRHDKDLPTMWENSFYIGGTDDGVLTAPGYRIGVALCWELMRTQTVHRLRGRVDVVLAGSGWWSIPAWRPARLFRLMEARNEATARTAAISFARYVGAPVVHAAHAGPLDCPTPWFPLRYRGHFEGCTAITSADGQVIARRHHSEGEGYVIGDIVPGAQPPHQQPPNRFWLHRRGTLPALAWTYQRTHGQRWYARHGGSR